METRHPTATSDKPATPSTTAAAGAVRAPSALVPESAGSSASLAPGSSLALDDLAMAAFDAMPAEAALLDPAGVIRYVNRAWRDFARANGGAADFYVGHNYFGILSKVAPPLDLLAMTIAQGVRAVLTGRADEFTSPDHRCHRPVQMGGRDAGPAADRQDEIEDALSILEKRWFRLLVRPLLLREGSNRIGEDTAALVQAGREPPLRWALLVYENVTSAHQPRHITGDDAPAGGTESGGASAEVNIGDHPRPARWSVNNAVFLQAILDDIADMVVTTDEAGQILSFNHAAERAFGFAAATVLGGNVSLLMAEPEAAQHDDHLKRYRDSGIGHVLGLTRHVQARRSDGGMFWVELRTTECWFDGHRLFVSTMRDLSERRQMEADLRQAKQAAEASNRAKSDFLARMSHELRTPLNSILGFAEVIKGQLFGNDPARYAGYAQNIYESGSWLLGLINDILDLSKIEAGRLELKILRQAPLPLIHASVDIVSAQLARKKLVLSLDLPPDLPPLDIDARAFQQILINVLSNAIKFNPGGGQIRIAGRVRPAVIGSAGDFVGDELMLSISDTGIGIPQEKIDLVLEPFGHSESGVGPGMTPGSTHAGHPGTAEATMTAAGASAQTTGQAVGGEGPQLQKGSGLGLSICKRLMELQHGRLALASQPGQGTTVTLTFPLPA